MAGGAFVVTNTPNNYVTPPAGGSVGTAVDTGATQNTDVIELDMGGVPGDGNAVDVQESQDNVSWFHLASLQGGDGAKTFTDVARYFRTVRQAGTATVACQWGKTTSSGGASGTDWLLNGNATTAGAGIGPLDGSAFPVGGLSAGSTTAIASGAGVPVTIIGAGNGAGTVGVSLAATTGNVTQRSVAGGFSFGANRALPATAAGQFAFDYATSWTASLAGVQQIAAGSGLSLAGGGTGGVSVGAGAAAAATVTNTFSLVTGAAGTIQVGHEANAHTLAMIDDGTTAQVGTIGSSFGASSLLLKSGTAGFALNAALPGSSGATLDTPAAGAFLIAPTNATSFQLGNLVAATGTSLIEVGAGILSILAASGGQIRTGGSSATFTNTADSLQVRLINNGPIVMIAAGSGSFTADSGTTGSVLLGNTNATAFQLGNTANTVTGTVRAGTFNLNVALASTVNLATGAAAQVLTAGSLTAASTTLILGAALGLGQTTPAAGTTQVEAPTAGGTLSMGINSTTVNVGAGGTATTSILSGATLNLGTNAVAQTITLGNVTGATSIAIRAGSGGLTIANNGVTWTWPTADGPSNAVLTTNGSGALRFTGGVNVFTQTTNAQSIANTGTPATLTTWTDVIANAAWVPSTGVFTAPAAGFYQFSVMITWAATAQALGALFVLSILKSNAPTTPQANSWSQPVIALAQVHSQTVTVGVSLALGETVSVQAALSGGTGANALTATANQNALTITQLH